MEKLPLVNHQLFYVYLLRQIKSQLKIIIRYSDALIGGLLVYISSGILLISLSKSSQVDLPLFCIILTVFSTGGMFGNLFCEKKNEIQGYMLTLWSIRQVILAKNAALIILTVALLLPLLVATYFIVPLSIDDYINVTLYFITSLPICLLLGNIVSVSRRALSSVRQAVSPMQLVILSTSPIPYMIFKSWMHSWTLCVSFFICSCIVWYFYELPWVEKNFQTVFYKISPL